MLQIMSLGTKKFTFKVAPLKGYTTLSLHSFDKLKSIFLRNVVLNTV